MELARQALSVLLVFALLGGAVLLLRRGSAAAWKSKSSRWRIPLEKCLRASAGPRPGAPGPVVERLGRLALTPQHVLHIVRVCELELVVATHPQGCSVVHAGSLAAGQTPRFSGGRNAEV